VSARRYIDTYLKGWELGDGALSLSVTADCFYYDDPNTGRIPRAEFVEFVEGIKRAAVEMGGAENVNPFLQYSDVVIKDDGSPVTVWCWWQAVGSELRLRAGQGQRRRRAARKNCVTIQLTTDLVEKLNSYKIAYFSRLPE
jgi:hypothetical protein